MAKKNKKKKDKKGGMLHFLNKNEDDLVILKKGKEISLKEATKETVKDAVAVSFDGVIPVTADEAIKKKEVPFNLAAHYSTAMFKLFEQGIAGKKNTLVMTIDAEDVIILQSTAEWGELAKKSTLDYVVENLERQMSKLKKWADRDPENDLDMFVMHVPDIILFKKAPELEEKNSPIYFNLLLQVVKGKKSLYKMSKKKDSSETLRKFIIKCTLENIKNFGASDVILPLTNAFTSDWYPLADSWMEMIKQDETLQKMTNCIGFTLESSTGFAIISNAVTEYQKIKSK